jgi:hypothetical protein
MADTLEKQISQIFACAEIWIFWSKGTFAVRIGTGCRTEKRISKITFSTFSNVSELYTLCTTINISGQSNAWFQRIEAYNKNQ